MMTGVMGEAAAADKKKRQIFTPFESRAKPVPKTEIDRLVAKELRKKKIASAPPCSDAIFIRRVFLDMIGTLPEPHEVRGFLKDRDPGKRAALIERLFEREEFADYWALKWCDLLRVKAEFPINLWPNAVQAYHRWIRDAVRNNMPYDEFAQALLTASGSNFRVPPVNFYRAVQGQEPSTLAAAVALTFMGARYDTWPEARRQEMAAFFSRVRFKTTAEWKEEIVSLDPTHIEPLDAVLPDGRGISIAEGKDPRVAFADWLIAKENPWFARNIVNRIWSWLFGRGIIHPTDDIRPDGSPVIPELLPYLEKELVKTDYNLRHIFTLILNSRTYQQSSISRSDHALAETLFAHYPVRRLEAEVLIDAICWVSGTRESYSSPIPEPFTFIPEEHRTIALEDGSISSQFLELFGRPARDTGLEGERNNEPTEAQALHLLNSTHVLKKIKDSRRLRSLMKRGWRNERRQSRMIQDLYLTILSRYPTDEEEATIRDYIMNNGVESARDSAFDVVWALINSKEFLYRH